jgi:hypothetical protein
MSHTTVPVRTALIQKILDTVKEEIPEVKTVRAFTAPPTDLVGIELPAAYLIEIQPEDRSISNRLAIGRVHLMFQIFLSTTMLDAQETSFIDTYEMMDIIAARLHHVFHNAVGLSKNGLVNVVEIQYDRVITNDAVGVLNATFDVEYRHDRGNAFS